MKRYLLSAVCGALLSTIVSGQAAKTPNAPPAKAPEVVKIGDVVVTGSIRTRLEGWNWFNADSSNGNYLFNGTTMRLGFGQSSKKLDWQLELESPLLLGLPTDAVAPVAAQGQLGLGGTYYANNDRQRNVGSVFAKQAFLRFKGNIGDVPASLRVGRFEFNDANEFTPQNGGLAAIRNTRISQRLIGTFGFTHIGRAFDGLQLTAGPADGKKAPQLTVVAALPTRGVFQTDGWGWANVGFTYAALNGQVEKKTNHLDYRVFGIYYQDWRNSLKVDNRPLAVRRGDLDNIRIGTYGANVTNIHDTAAGSFDVMGWVAVQNGSFGKQSHRSASFAAEAGFQPKALPKLKPWIRGGYNWAQGDGNPNDTRHTSFHQMLPTPRIYARMPFYTAINNQDIFGTLILRPNKKALIRADYHHLSLANRNDLWSLGGGAFNPWVFGFVGRPSNGKKGLANFYDVSLDYTVNPHWTISPYVGYAQGGEVVKAIYPKGSNGAFAFLELTYKF
jgi:hypothetical protein